MNMFLIILIRQRPKEIMKISNVLLEDIDNLIILELDVLGHTLGKELMVNDCINDNSLYLKIEEKDKIIGYVSIRINGNMSEILNLVIDKNNQNKGYGKILMNYVFDKTRSKGIKSVVLDVRTKNTRAIHFYESLGFKRMLIRKNYYINDDAYVYMWEE